MCVDNCVMQPHVLFAMPVLKLCLVQDVVAIGTGIGMGVLGCFNTNERNTTHFGGAPYFDTAPYLLAVKTGHLRVGPCSRLRTLCLGPPLPFLTRLWLGGFPY